MSNKKKDLILEAARNVLKTEGSANFSMRKVAASAGMSLGNLQYYFKTKDTLFEGLLAQYMTQYRNRYLEYMETPLTKEILAASINEILEDEATNNDKDIYQILYSYAEAGGLSKINQEDFIKEVYQLLYSFLANTDASVSARKIHLACSFLIPYFHSYSFYYKKLGASIDAIEKFLTDTVGDLIGIV